MRHRLRHATRPDAPLGRSRGSLPSSVLTLALLAIVAALASPSSAGGPGSERAFLISHRSGSTYESRSVPFGQVRTGGLKAIVEEAMAILGGAGGGTITFERGVFDFESGHIELNHVENLAFEGQGIDATILRNHSDAAADTEVFDVSSADRVQIRDMTIHAGGSVRFTSDAIDFDGGKPRRDRTGQDHGVEGTRHRLRREGTGVRSADHNVIRDCIVTGVSSTGIELLASSNNVIESCTVTDVGRHGIHVTKASKVAEQAHKPSNGNIVRANTVDQAGLYGIAVTASDPQRHRWQHRDKQLRRSIRIHGNPHCIGGRSPLRRQRHSTQRVRRQPGNEDAEVRASRQERRVQEEQHRSEPAQR